MNKRDRVIARGIQAVIGLVVLVLFLAYLGDRICDQKELEAEFKHAITTSLAGDGFSLLPKKFYTDEFERDGEMIRFFDHKSQKTVVIPLDKVRYIEEQ